MAQSKRGPARYPCASCPYRLDVPSGVWAAEEYEKLPPYDGPTWTQPVGAFFCHQQNGRLCAGWCGTHDMNESLALRFAAARTLEPEDVQAALDYESPVPLFASGAEAAEHGVRDIDAPEAKAQRTITKLQQRRTRRTK